MRKRHLLFCFVMLALSLPAMAQPPQRVVSLLGSYAEAWLQAGGSLVGVTQDALTERQLNLDENTAQIGDNKNPSLELIISLEPDLVIYSTELEGQVKIARLLQDMGVSVMGFEVTGYQDYMHMMETFTRLTGRDDLYQNQAALVSEPIEETIARAQNHPDYQKKTALLLRAWSSGVRAKGSDNLAGYMLRDMGLINIADGHSLMENLTLEAILAADPDYIFITVMGGSEEQALSYLDETLMKNPAWQGLSAVKEGHVSVLDRTLFHLKPNARWAQAYESLYTLLYEEPS